MLPRQFVPTDSNYYATFLSPPTCLSFVFVFSFLITRTITSCAILTFLVPIAQLSIGFRHIVGDGTDSSVRCRAAPDLPLILAIGGIFALFFLGSAYAFLKMVSSVGEKVDSDVSGKMPKILIGLVSFIFGSITFIFFILMQMRVYRAYSTSVQTENQTETNYCQSAIIRGGLSMIILTYLSVLLFIVVVVLILCHTKQKLKQEKLHEMEMTSTDRF